MAEKTYAPLRRKGAAYEGRASMDFAVPSDAGEYAEEVLYLEWPSSAQADDEIIQLAYVTELSLLVAALPTGATVEVDLLKPEQNVSGTWRTAVQSHTTTGLKSPLALARWRGVRVRVKSGGTDGTASVDASWWS